MCPFKAHNLRLYAAAEAWYAGIEKWKEGQYFFSHITEIIRLATLWKYGGGAGGGSLRAHTTFTRSPLLHITPRLLFYLHVLAPPAKNTFFFLFTRGSKLLRSTKHDACVVLSCRYLSYYTSVKPQLRDKIRVLCEWYEYRRMVSNS